MMALAYILIGELVTSVVFGRSKWLNSKFVLSMTICNAYPFFFIPS